MYFFIMHNKFLAFQYLEFEHTCQMKDMGHGHYIKYLHFHMYFFFYFPSFSFWLTLLLQFSPFFAISLKEILTWMIIIISKWWHETYLFRILKKIRLKTSWDKCLFFSSHVFITKKKPTKTTNEWPLKKVPYKGELIESHHRLLNIKLPVSGKLIDFPDKGCDILGCMFFFPWSTFSLPALVDMFVCPMLEKTEVAIKNGQSRKTSIGNIRHKTNKTQHQNLSYGN